MAQENQAETPDTEKSGATLLLETVAATPADRVIEQLLRDHPALTREQAVEHLKAAGFF